MEWLRKKAKSPATWIGLAATLPSIAGAYFYGVTPEIIGDIATKIAAALIGV